MLPPTIRRDLSKAEIKPSGKVWTEGTLTYTGVGLAMLFFWLLWGDFSWAMKDRGVSPVATLLFKKYSASDFLVGMLLVSIPMLLSMLAGPIVSYKSDRHRGRFGRRIPFLLVQTPIAALAMVGLAFSPFLGKLFHATLGAFSPGQDGSVLFFVGTFWVVFNVTSIVANTIFQGLINDVVPREMLGRFFGAFRAVSLIAGMIFNRWIFAKAETGYFWIFLGMAALYGGGFISMCLKVKEGNYPPPPPPDPNRGVPDRQQGLPKGMFREALFSLVFRGAEFFVARLYTDQYLCAFLHEGPAYGPPNVWKLLCSLLLLFPSAYLSARESRGSVSSAADWNGHTGYLHSRVPRLRIACPRRGELCHRHRIEQCGRRCLDDRGGIDCAEVIAEKQLHPNRVSGRHSWQRHQYHGPSPGRPVPRSPSSQLPVHVLYQRLHCHCRASYKPRSSPKIYATRRAQELRRPRVKKEPGGMRGYGPVISNLMNSLGAPPSGIRP
jgi:MFS family permease